MINAVSYKFNKGHLLYKEGDQISGKSIFMVKTGKVQITYLLKNNMELRFYIKPGGLFGVIEALSDEDIRITNARFLEDSVVYLWNKDDFVIDSGMIAELGVKSISFLSTMLRAINQKIQEKG